MKLIHILTAAVLLFFHAGNFCFAGSPMPVREPQKKVVQINAYTGANRFFIGTVSTACPQRYAVVKHTDNGRKRLFKKGDWINTEFKIMEISKDFMVVKDTKNELKTLLPRASHDNLEFEMAVEPSHFEYWYRTSDKIDAEYAMFEFAGMRDNTAILERDYKASVLMPSAHAKKGTGRYGSACQSADEVFFSQLKTKKMGPDVWLVDSKSVTDSAVNNAGKALSEAAKKAEVSGFGKQGLKLTLKSNSAQATLDKSGFAVDSLSSSVKDKAGLVDGDIIKSINGRQVTSIIDMIALFMKVKNDNVTNVRVDIMRNNRPKTLTYVVN